MKNLFKPKNGVIWLFCFTLLFNLRCSMDDSSPDIQETIDIDGNHYSTIKIGDQIWMKENLKVTKYKNGDPITYRNFAEWRAAPNDDDEGVYCYKGDDMANMDILGLLYNWHAATDPRGLAPEGWHIPSNIEWQTLVDFIGGQDVGGGKLKEKGFDHWDVPNTGATDEFGFTALPGGLRGDAVEFESIEGKYTYFLTTDESVSFPETSVIVKSLREDRESICCSLPGNSTGPKFYGYSVRCVKD